MRSFWYNIVLGEIGFIFEQICKRWGGALKVGIKCKSRLNSNRNLCRYGEILPQMDNFLSLYLIGRKFLKLRMKLNSQASITLKPYIDFFNQVNFHQRGGGQGHPDALKKLGQKQKRGPQIEPHRLCYFWNRSLLMTEIHLKSTNVVGSDLGGPFLVYVSNFLKFLVWKPTSGWASSSWFFGST